MVIQEYLTLYDILDVKPDAGPDEIRNAYFRAKAAYGKDSLALYTLMDSQDMREMMTQIEEAYETLSHPERRKHYDRHHGQLAQDSPVIGSFNFHPDQPPGKIVSIDRVPPMDKQVPDDELLVPPSTDFPTQLPPLQRHPPQPPAISAPRAPEAAAVNPITREIENETEWRGTFLKRVREDRRLSIEEVSNITRIPKAYLQAIEGENFEKLPAAVFSRGFVIQVAKVLKLPHDKVAIAFMARYHVARKS